MSDVTNGWTEEAVFARFRAVLADVLVLDEDEITRASKLVDDLDADSIGFLELTWRLRQDFGVPVPEVKVDEETLTMSLLEGLEHIGTQATGITLFDFMKDVASRGTGSTLGGRAVRTLRDLISGPDFPLRLRATVARAGDDERSRTLLVALRHEVRSNPDLEQAFSDVLARHEDLAEGLQRIEDETPSSAELNVDGILPLWADLLSSTGEGRQLFDLRVSDLGSLLGAGVPDGIDPDATIDGLILRDLFRFITVDVYVQYILFLHESAGAGERDEA